MVSQSERAEELHIARRGQLLDMQGPEDATEDDSADGVSQGLSAEDTLAIFEIMTRSRLD